jgi:hypothetical protein
MQLAANHRSDAVRTDEHSRTLSDAARAVDDDVVTVETKAGDGASQPQRIGADGVEQHSMEHRTQDAIGVLSEQARRGGSIEAAQDRTVRPAHLTGSHDRAAFSHRIADAELPQGGHRIRREEQGEAELTRRGRALDDDGIPACAAQRDRRGEAADAGACDDRTRSGGGRAQ